MPASSLILKLSLDGWLPDNATRAVAAANESSALLAEAVLSDIELGGAVLGKIALGEVTMSETVLAKVPLVEVVVADDLLRMVIRGCWVPFAFPFLAGPFLPADFEVFPNEKVRVRQLFSFPY